MRVSFCSDVCSIAAYQGSGGIHDSACNPKKPDQVQRPGLEQETRNAFI
jgi:hypothetical protein